MHRGPMTALVFCLAAISANPAAVQATGMGTHIDSGPREQHLAPTGAEASAEAQTGESILLRIGHPGIYCVRLPCPSRGIIAPTAENREPATPVWVGTALPPLVAGEAQTRRIESAWDNQQCLIVEGSFDGRTLTVARIVEEC